MDKTIKNAFKVGKSTTRGIVAAVDDPAGNNRLKVYIPTIHNENIGDGIWCTSGLLSPPDVGDVVLVGFDNDDIRVGMVFSNVSKCNTLDVDSLTSSSSALSSVSADTLVALIAEILKEHEAGDEGYECLVPNDKGAISVGLLGWHEDNARDVFQRIKKLSAADWGRGDSLHKSLSDSWVGYNPSNYTGDCDILKEILATSSSKTAQDAILQESILGYIEEGKNCGVVDSACVIYYCDFANQGHNGAQAVAKWCGTEVVNDLDKFHKKVYGCSDWPCDTAANKARRLDTYNKIVDLKNSGALDEVTLSEYTGGELCWPVPGFPKIAYRFGYKSPDYGSWHPGVDINSEGAGGKDIYQAQVVAACNGVAYFIDQADSYGAGNAVHLISSEKQKFNVYYFHLDGFAAPYKGGDSANVKRGQYIANVGNTGTNTTGNHLHFELRVGGTSRGAKTEEDHGNLVDPEPYLVSDEVGTNGYSLVGYENSNSLLQYDTKMGNEKCPPEARTDYEKCALNKIVPFINPDISVGSAYAPECLLPVVQYYFDLMREAFVEAYPSYEQYFVICAGYRSFSDQIRYYQYVANCDSMKATTYTTRVAQAGHSEHQLGLAIDLYKADWSAWYTKPLYPTISNWLYANAHKYGFIIRYPKSKESITGYPRKDYHLRYVGIDIATKVYNNGTYLALEEILKTKS